MCGSHAKARGFTLLELLVAVSLFALAMAMAYGGLNGIVRARAQLQEDAERLGQWQFALGLLERDVRSTVARPVRDAQGRVLPALLLESGGLELTRGGHANALDQPRAELERVRWQLVGEQLLRGRYAALDRVDAQPLADAPVLDAIAGLEFAALDASGRWLARWPDPRMAADALPRALRVRLRSAGFGEIERVLELPDSEPQP